MAAYNGGPYLQQSIDSILQQTFRDFEFVIVDDASTDDTPSIIRSYPDKRIIAVTNNVNLGLTKSLNVGIRHCRGHYLARMDADDRMHPRRLEQQLEFMDRHTDIDVLGCRVCAFPDTVITDGFQRYLDWINRSLTHAAIVADLFRESPLAHPSVMIRWEALDKTGGYRAFDGPEDYDLWLRMARHGARFAKLDACLLDWRVSAASLSRTDQRYRRDAFRRLAWQFLTDHLHTPGSHSGKELWICGGGTSGRRLRQWLERRSLRVTGFIDVAPARVDHTLDGIPVRSAASIPKLLRNGFLLFNVGNWGAAEAFEILMRQQGAVPLRDYLVVHG